MRTSNTPLNRIIRQTQLLGLVLLSWCWAASAQSQLAFDNFDGSIDTFTTNFFNAEGTTPWAVGVGLTNSDGLTVQGTSGGNYTNRTFDFATTGRQYIITMWGKKGNTPSGSNKPFLQLGLSTSTNFTINTSNSGGTNRNISLAVYYYKWFGDTLGDRFVMLGMNTPASASSQTKEQSGFDKPTMNDGDVYPWHKLTVVLANLGGGLVQVNGALDAYSPDGVTYGRRDFTAVPYVFSNPDICTARPVYAAWRSRNTANVSALDLFEVAEAPIPAAPTQAQPSLGDGYVGLSWSFSQYALGHNVYRATSPGGPYVQLVTLGITNGANTYVTNANFTKYSDTALILGTTYWYYVTATNLAGESLGSATNSILYNPAVQNLVAIGGTNQISLSWTLLGGATNYIIYRSGVSGGPYTAVGTNIATSYMDTGLQAGQRYYYYVQGTMNGGVPSGASAEASAFTAPGTPAGAFAEPFTASVLRFGWTTADTVPATTFIEASSDGVHFSPVGVGTNCTATYGPHWYGNTCHFYLTGLAPSTMKYFRAYAGNASGFSPPSAIVSATTLPVPGVNVNFCDISFPTFGDWPIPDYLDDYGQAYGLRTNGWTYGWDTDKTANALTRGYYAMDDRYRTLNQMYSSNSWTLNVTNGIYLVHVAGGDPSSASSSQINVQGLDSAYLHPDGIYGPWWVDFWQTASVTGGTLVISNGIWVSNNRLLFLNVYPAAPEANTITTQPQSQSVIENAQAAFSVWVGGGPVPYGYQWYSNSVAIPGANARTYTIPAVTMADAASYYVAVTNAGASVNSSVAVLTVTPRIAPVLLAAGSVDGTTIGLSFDEALDPGVQDPSLYTVNGGAVTVTSAILRPDLKAINLTLDAPVTGSFSVTVTNILDAYSHTLATATVTSSVLGLINQDIGTTYSGDSFTADNVNIEVTGGGGDIYNIQDGCRFVYRTMDGDFDARVRVTGLTSESHPISKAVLMARETTDAGSVDIMIDVNAPYSQVDSFGNHGRDQYSSDCRSVTGGGTALWGWYLRPASIPDCWIRLLRLGSEFRAYRSLDGGTTWIQTGSNTLSTSSQLLVGLAVTAHNAGALATATFQGLTVAPPAPDVAITKTASVSTVLSGGTFQYTVNLKNQGVASASSVTVSDPLPAGITYVSSSASAGSASYSSGTVTWDAGALNVGQSATLTINVTAAYPGTKVNTATAATAGEANLANNSSSATVIVLPLAPQLTGPVYNPGTTNFSLSLGTEIGVSYTLQYATNLAAPIFWQGAQSIIGDGTVRQLQDPAAAEGQRFYRVVIP